MVSPDKYLARVQDALGGSMIDGRISLELKWNTKAEAQMFIKKLRLMQKDLRLVKKDLSQTMREMRSEVAARKARIGAGFGAGVAIGLLGRRMAGKFNALRRDSLRETQLEALAPYESVARVIDEALYQLDRAKLQLESWTPGSEG